MIVDYIWGPATEALSATLNNHDLSSYAGRARHSLLVNVGSMAAPDIRLPAACCAAPAADPRQRHRQLPPIPEMQRYATEILALAATGALTIETQEHGLAGDRRGMGSGTRKATCVR
ncbi:hypothetical protein M8494_26305 [Serratia ureilytica]